MPVSDIDQVSIAGAGAFAGTALELTVSCELMHNQLPGSPISPTATKLAVVQDAGGNPVVFSIGTDGHLRLIKVKSGTSDGFAQIDLSAQFTGYGAAAAFDVIEDAQGRISLAVALARADTSATDLFLATKLANDFADATWSAFVALMGQPLGGIDAGFAAEAVLLGTSDADMDPLLTVVGPLNGKRIYYQATAKAAGATAFAFPETVTAPTAMANAFKAGGQGIWFLYAEGDSCTLECTTLANASGPSYTYDLSPGGSSVIPPMTYRCLATATGTDTDPFSISSDVYVGSDKGIYLFRDGRSEKMQRISGTITDCQQIIVRQDSRGIALWALSAGADRLHYAFASRDPDDPDAAYRWNTPIVFSESAVRLAPLRVRTRNANEVFLVDKDLNVSHHWQDPKSTLWQKRVITAAAGDYLFDVTTFTSRIHLDDAAGDPARDVEMDVTASEWIYVTINGMVYSLDSETPCRIKTDALGSLTIVATAGDIATPILHITSAAFDKVVNLYPNGKVQRGLRAVKTGDDLKNAKAPDGTPIVPPMSGDKLTAVAANVNRLAGVGTQDMATAPLSGATFVTIADAKHGGLVDAKQLPEGFAVGMHRAGGAWHPTPRPPVMTMMADLGGVGDVFETLAGDALHFLETAVDEAISAIEGAATELEGGISFVIQKVKDGVEDALQFVIHLPGKLLKVALTTLSSVYKALNWLLKLIKVALVDMLKWLGHLFGWDDIWAVHKVITTMVDNGIEAAVAFADKEIDWLIGKVDAAFDGLEDRIEKAVLPSSGSGGAGSAAKKTPQGLAARSAPSGLAQYQIHHGGMLNSTADDPATSALDLLRDFVDDVMIPTMRTLGGDLKKDIDDIRALAEKPDVNALLRFVVDTVKTIIDPLKTLMTGILKFVKDVLNFIKSALIDPVDIPFLSGFYRMVTTLLGDGETLTAVNGMALLLAIPIVESARVAGVSLDLVHRAEDFKSPAVFAHFLSGAGGAARSPAPLAPSAEKATVAAGPRDGVVGQSRVMARVEATDPGPGAATEASGPHFDFDTFREQYILWGTTISAMAGAYKNIAQAIRVQQPPTGPMSYLRSDKLMIALNVIRNVCSVPLTFDTASTSTAASSLLKIYAYSGSVFYTVTSGAVYAGSGWIDAAPENPQVKVSTALGGFLQALSGFYAYALLIPADLLVLDLDSVPIKYFSDTMSNGMAGMAGLAKFLCFFDDEPLSERGILSSGSAGYFLAAVASLAGAVEPFIADAKEIETLVHFISV